jgi:hypothetical protein
MEREHGERLRSGLTKLIAEDGRIGEAVAVDLGWDWRRQAASGRLAEGALELRI